MARRLHNIDSSKTLTILFAFASPALAWSKLKRSARAVGLGRCRCCAIAGSALRCQPDVVMINDEIALIRFTTL
jgi:hypothetical protein